MAGGPGSSGGSVVGGTLGDGDGVLGLGEVGEGGGVLGVLEPSLPLPLSQAANSASVSTGQAKRVVALIEVSSS
ncbi:hypothetical protein AKJ09_03274 [Labilithrix luteola]|uniref:Uncharacterized protein n=1 Tax=Labilithrix luteola TaxID=1391654 RepID=A0A0K1PSU1_9BACT|nr:hypothetical protein AKJ09_03274 [Labilithrix luteola]